ncbi:MFS transporter [Paraburkholderia sabiae]|uniref:MFS transporter n=1 Tax=Paraburkholderia sabiae TaxID=273251 RepID=A0ABU9QB31_9BURK|nr:MFS transporter [Paraburkholderia sabiae]WJZ72359.1 MFS transporter [Paraburkholderia sabiae]CAD6537476.1 Putative metabolite transport protein YjhB [Paraburkholderia sabiae]
MQQPLEERSGGMRAQSRSADENVVWYRSISRKQWKALAASNLGWFFDGYETYALVLTVGVALGQLLAPSAHAQIPFYAGLVIALTLLGWGIGGLIGGILTDYIGRKRMMMLAILAYSLTTGLSALSWDWASFAALRFVVGLAMGSEWATGTAMTAEIWPDRHRGKGAGLMQCGLGTGFFVASLIWLFVSGMGEHAWRYMYLIGVLPGLATLWMRAGIPESEQWERVNAQRKATRERKKAGAVLDDGEQALTRFTLTDLLADPKLRRRTWIAVLMSLSTTLGWWGISTWVPPYIGAVAARGGLPAAQWASFAGMAYNIGAIAGYIGLGFLADAYGRKRVTALFFAVAFIITPVLFMWTHDVALLLVVACVSGFFSLGQYTWMPTWLPELYPTRVRGTAIALCFNVPRFLAWTGPLVAGTLIARFGGYGHAAVTVGFIYLIGLALVPFLPETRGNPLPEQV